LTENFELEFVNFYHYYGTNFSRGFINAGNLKKYWNFCLSLSNKTKVLSILKLKLSGETKPNVESSRSFLG